MGTRASDIIAYVDAASSFGMKIRIEKVRGNRVEITVSSFRNLCFGEEKKVRFRGGEMVFHRMKVGTKATNVAEVNVEKVGGRIKTPLWVVTCSGVRPGEISGPLP